MDAPASPSPSTPTLVKEPTQKELADAAKSEKALLRKLQGSLPPASELCDVDPQVIVDIKVALFDTRLEDARRQVELYYQKNCWAMSVYCESGLIEFFIGEKTPEAEAQALTRMQLAISQAEAIIKLHKNKTEKRAEGLAMEAHSFLTYGVFLINTNSYVRAAYYVRKSWKRWEAAGKLIAELAAKNTPVSKKLQALVSFGEGFFYFGISMVPPQMEFVVKMLGFKGNRPLACKLLQVSAETPECGKAIESSLILYVMKFWLLDERDAAVELLEGLKKSLPNSPLIYLMHGWQCMIKDKDTDRALENYRAGWELAHIPQLRLGFTQQMAWAHYLREDWEDVVRLTEQFLAETKNKDSGSYSAFSMGLALHMLGRADQSKLAMEKCVAIAEKSNNWDSYALHIAKAYLANGNQFENANDAGRSAKALSYLGEIDTLPWTGYTEDDKAAMAAYFRGCALRIDKEFERAKSCFIKAAGFHSRTLALGASRAVPYALVCLGEMAMRDMDPPQLDAASRFFAKAKSYDKKYMFADLLQFRLKSDLEVLASKQEKAPAK